MFSVSLEPLTLRCNTDCIVTLRVVNHNDTFCTNVHFQLKCSPSVTIFHRRDIHFDRFPPRAEQRLSFSMRATQPGEYQLLIARLSYRDSIGQTMQQDEQRLKFKVITVPEKSYRKVQTANSTEIAFWRRQLEQYRDSLRLIEEQEARFVLPIDIPLQLRREKESVLAKIAELEAKLARTNEQNN